MSLHFFKNFTGFLSLSAFSSNLQFLPSGSLTILFQFTFLVHSLSINHLALSVLLLKGFSLSLQLLLSLPIHALFLPLFPRSGTRSRPISEISHPFHSSNLVLNPISSNLPLQINPSLWLNVFTCIICFLLINVNTNLFNIFDLYSENDEYKCIVWLREWMCKFGALSINYRDRNARYKCYLLLLLLM